QADAQAASFSADSRARPRTTHQKYGDHHRRQKVRSSRDPDVSLSTRECHRFRIVLAIRYLLIKYPGHSDALREVLLPSIRNSQHIGILKCRQLTQQGLRELLSDLR